MADDDKKVALFRKKLLEDGTFRKAFAADPGLALRGLGIDVPESAQIPAIDLAQLEDRVAKTRAVLGTKVADLYDNKAFGDLAKDRATFTQIETLTNIGSRVGSPVLGGRQVVYTISAFGTIDW